MQQSNPEVPHQSNSEGRQRVLTKQMVAYDKTAVEALQRTLQFSGLKLGQQIDYRPVRIYQIDHLHEIYTLGPSTNLPHMVLLHGFGGTGMTYLRFFPILRDQYQMHALDLLGVGHSSKGVFRDDFTYEQARHYFVDAIEQWRAAAGIGEFVLVGHSFGGYLAACYTETYPGRVTRLIMLSPAGATDRTPEQVQEQLAKRSRGNGLRGRILNYFAETIYNLKIRPSRAMSSWLIGDRLIDQIVDVRFKLKQQQSEAWKSYFRDLSTREAVSEAGFYIIFEWPLKTKHTIEAMVTSMGYSRPIEFYYGYHDWMDSRGAVKLAQEFHNVKFNTISGAGHQLIFDNPEEVCYYILLRRTKEEQHKVSVQKPVMQKGEDKAQAEQSINHRSSQ